jgi:branched-chain amino acid transport system ATP-binding protein
MPPAFNWFSCGDLFKQNHVNARAASYGGVHAVRQVDLSIETGRRHVILGPNGAEKSTLVNLLCGAILPSAGSIQFKAMEISELPACKRAQLGIARTFQVSQLFGHLTVQENVLIALFPSRFGLRRLVPASAERRREIEQAATLLAEWGLKEDFQAKASHYPMENSVVSKLFSPWHESRSSFCLTSLRQD